MRILHLVHQYMPDHIGGTELYTYWLTHALSRRGHQITIFYRRSAEGIGQDHWPEDDIQIQVTWAGMLSPTRRFMATFGDVPMMRSFERVLEGVQPDLVHIQHLMGHPVSLLDSIQRRGIPFVITLWDFWWVCANAQLLTNYSQQMCDGPEAYLNCVRCALARIGPSYLWPVWPALSPLAGLLTWRNHLLRKVMQAAGKLIAPTAFVYDWYAAHGAPTENLVTVSPGLDLPMLQARPVRRSDAPVRFAYIGGLSWQKGVHVLVEAFSGVEKGAELWIGGDEATDPNYVARLHALASPSVRFLGRLTREEVWQALVQVDVVVVPSMWYETFSFIVSEAFAAGAPVIASRLGPLVDRVQDGVDGLLVPPGDSRALQNAILRFVQDPALLPRLRAGIRPVRTVEEHAQDIESVYREVRR